MAMHVGRAGLAAAVGVAWAAMGAAGTTVVPSEKGYVRDLGGKWRFKLEQKGEVPAKGRIGGPPEKFTPPATLEAFEAEGYAEGPDWKEIVVPGNWEMQGWSPATFNQPNNEIGLYRLEFDVPREWEGRVVKVDFDGVQNSAEVYCNGRPVKVDEPTQGRENYHQGGNDAFQADLTPAVKYGRKNVLAVRVYKNPEGVDLDTGDFFFLGGIHRKVTLFSVPRTHIEDLKVETKVTGGGKADVTVGVEVAGAKEGMKVEGHLEGLDVPPVVTDAGHGLAWKVEKAEYWSAEKPKLYDLRVELKDAKGEVVETVRRRVGIREVSIEGGVLMVNHVPVKFTGMCRHENFAPLGTAINEEVWRKDIEMMKAANVNAIRTSHYPYGAGFYDLCDELGMYVMDEMSAGWVPTDTKRLTPFFQQHAREMVRRDKNHPSVVVWAVGNENKKGFNNKAAAEEIRKLDATRPRLISWHDAEEGGVELDDRHYTNPDEIKKANDNAERRKTYPMTYLENPNDWEARNGADWGNLDLWGEVIKRTWDVVWDAEHVPGSFLWEWRDRAVADASEPKLYDYFPKSNTQLVKVKGQVDGWGNPRPSLFHVKMAYAPVRLDLTPVVRGDEVVVHARNYYSFTDVNELKTTWHLLDDGKEIKGGEAKVSLAPRSKGDFKFELPREEMRRADAMRVEFDTADGRNVATYVLRLKPEAQNGPKLADAEDVRFPRFNLVTATYGVSPKTGWRQAFRHRASLTNVRIGGKPADAIEKMALRDVKDLEADVVMDESPGTVVGKLKAGYEGGKLRYRVEWVGAEKGDVQELGWVFDRPAAEDRFSWKHQTMWSWYPADHIGRPTGTARPDSADQDISKLTRPDAFDWNSTKYACDWATLAGGEGTGLGVRFDASQRHQVRAGTGKDGGSELVVNLWCCPPRDLSSGIVPDLYFTFEKGKVAEGAFAVGAVGKQ